MSWIIPAQISTAFTISPHSPSPGFTSPLFGRPASIPPHTQVRGQSQNLWITGRTILPTESNWDLRKLNTSQAQNSSMGSREGILSSGLLTSEGHSHHHTSCPPCTLSVFKKFKKKWLSSLIFFKLCCQQFCFILNSKRVHILRI